MRIDDALVSIRDRVGQVSYSDDGAIYVAALPLGPPHVLEGIAAVIWTHLTSPTRISDLIRMLAEESGLPPSQIDPDVRAFVQSLQLMRLVELAPVPSESGPPPIS